MSLFVVDEEKCKRDGICVIECPLGLLKMKDADSTPTPVKGADKICINCGHCLVVCPHGALSLKTMLIKDCQPIDEKLSVTPEQIEQFMRSRRSVRRYKDKVVEREKITKLLDIARFAPSGHNIQEVGWLVLYEKEEVERLKGIAINWMRKMIKEVSPMGELIPFRRFVDTWENGIDAICHNAPHLIVAHAPKDYPFSQIDCTIALTYLELASHAFNLGVCWAGVFNIAATNWPPLQDALGLPDGNINFGSLMIGYPKFKYYRMPQRNEAEIIWR